MDPIRRVNTTMPESLLQKVDLYSRLNLEDRATAIRQLVAEGLRVKLQQTVLEQYRRAKITIREGADLLGITYLEMDELLGEHRIPLVSEMALALRSARKDRPRPAGPGRSRNR